MVARTSTAVALALLAAPLLAAAQMPKLKCPEQKFYLNETYFVDVLGEWTGQVLSTPQGPGNLTQADLDVTFYADYRDALYAKATYSNPMEVGVYENIEPCTATFKVGCFEGHNEDYTLQLLNSTDSCWTSEKNNDWRCKYYLTSDYYQQRHAFSFALQMRYTQDPADAPTFLRGAPFGAMAMGCGSPLQPRALEWRLGRK